MALRTGFPKAFFLRGFFFPREIALYRGQSLLSLKPINPFHHPSQHMAGSVPASLCQLPILLGYYTGQERQSLEHRAASWATRFFLFCFYLTLVLKALPTAKGLESPPLGRPTSTQGSPPRGRPQAGFRHSCL